MNRKVHYFGIDIGHINSNVAVNNDAGVEVIKNSEGSECTPSAVWKDENNVLFVGRRAKKHLADDQENVFCGIKRRMIAMTHFTFGRDGRRMSPEELGAELLKAIKSDVRQRTGEDIQAAAISVPLEFGHVQFEAMLSAAELAGITVSRLLKEPVAAAIAYGFQKERDKTFWMVYDFGGGTFYAAIIQVRESEILLVNYNGDNRLCGELIDWEIVNRLLIPDLIQKYPLREFHCDNRKWRSAFGKLKLHAEEAKIRVSRDRSAKVIIASLCRDDDGNPVDFEHTLNREDVQRLMGPFIARSIDICQKLLTDSHLAPWDIQKLILVGGTTLDPYLREKLSESLSIPLECRIDPLTVIARGAAILAGVIFA